MYCIVYKDSKEWFFRVKKGKCLLKLDEEEIHVLVDCEKEIYLEDAYVYMFEEDSGFAKYKKYEIKDELILSKYSYASIQLFELDNDIVINIKNKIISKNHNVFVDYRLQNRFEMNNVIAILNLRLIVTEQFVLINQPNSVTINLNSKDEFRYRQYQYINSSMDYEIHRNKKEAPKLLIEFRQFDKIIAHEKMSNLIMVVPMLMMLLASLVVGINSSYNSYLQGKDGFDLAIPLILPCTMLISVIFVKPIHSYIEKHQHEKKLMNRNKLLDNYFYELEEHVSEFENELNTFNSISYLLPEDIEINRLKKIYLANQANRENLIVVLGKGDIQSSISYAQIPSHGDYEYYSRYLKFKNDHTTVKNKLVLLKLFEVRSIVIKDTLLFEWVLLQLCFYCDNKSIEIYLFTSEEWLHNRKEYLFLNLIVVTSKNFEVSTNTEKSRIALISDERNYENCDLIFTSVIFLNDSMSICDCSVSIKNNCYIYNNSTEFHNDITWQKINIFKNNVLKYYGKEFKVIHNYYKLFDLYQLEITKSYINRNWINNKTYTCLKAPIGICNGEIFELDLNEKVHGPHILIGSTTGGGKSEAIITILYSLAIKYSFRYFQFAIIDFKGGGLADAFKLAQKVLPHCVGSLTNLDNSEMERLIVSFENESKRRQQLFSKMVSISKQSPMDIGKYQKLVDDGIALPQLAHLLYVIDEFAELKMIEPSFVNELIRIARTGRSLGIHLILSTQKPASVVDGQIWANSNTRICLKVQDRQDSMEMIGSDKGAFLKYPGQFYLFNNQRLIEGQIALTSSTYSYEDKTTIRILTTDLQNEKNNEDKGLSQITTLLNMMATTNENPQRLWQQSLKNENCHLNSIQRYQIGTIDDISNNSQYPFIYEYHKNMIVFSMNRGEKHKFLKIVMNRIICEFDNQYEIVIVDFDKMINDIYTSYDFIRIITNKYMLDSLMKTVINNIEIDHDLIIIITHYPTFLEYLEDKHYLVEQLLHRGANKRCYFLFLTNTSNSIKYSLLHHFNIRVTLSIENLNECMSIFEKPMKTCNVDKDFGYVMEKEIKLFKLIQEPLQKLDMNLKCRFKKIRLISENVTVKRDCRIILGVDMDMMEEIELKESKLLFVIAKYSSGYHKFIMDTFNNYCKVKSVTDLNQPKIIIDYEEFNDDIEDLIRNNLNNTSIVIACSQDDWYHSWMRNIYKGINIIWIGEGFHEQTILRNEHWIKLTNNEAFYISSKDTYKLRCIDNYEE